MKKIASPTELQDELRAVLAYTRTDTPSRERIATHLRSLASRLENYPDARARILQELPQHGWQVKPNLKVPWAKRRNDRDNIVWFKAQAVYLNEDSLFLDIRGMPTADFIKRLETKMDRD